MTAAKILSSAMDTAQQMVTACLHGEREMAADLAVEYPHPEVLALALADLVAYTHDRWTRALGGGFEERAGSWRALLTDVEEWRTETGK